MGRSRQPRPLPSDLPEAARDLILELRSLKDRSGLDLRALESRTYASRSSWGRWLSGQSWIPADAVEALAELCGGDARHLRTLWDRADTQRRVSEMGTEPTAIVSGSHTAPAWLKAGHPPNGNHGGSADHPDARNALNGVRPTGADPGPGEAPAIGDAYKGGPATTPSTTAPSEAEVPESGNASNGAPVPTPLSNREPAETPAGSPINHRPAETAGNDRQLGDRYVGATGRNGRPDDTWPGGTLAGRRSRPWLVSIVLAVACAFAAGAAGVALGFRLDSPPPPPRPKPRTEIQWITRKEVMARVQSWHPGHPDRVPYSQTNLRGGYRTDGSGYASMALGLPQPGPISAELTGRNYTKRIPVRELRSGDLIINASGGANVREVIIFDRWAGSSHRAYWAYQQRRGYGTDHLTLTRGLRPGDGYRAYRPLNIHEFPPTTARTPPT